MSATPTERATTAANTARSLIEELDGGANRASIRRQATALVSQLDALIAHLRRTTIDPGALGSAARREQAARRERALRPENALLEPPEVVEERWGVAPAPTDGPVPEWFRERFGRLAGSDE